MPMRAPRICSCGRRVAYGERCQCQKQRDRAADAKRPSAALRGYDSEWRELSRAYPTRGSIVFPATVPAPLVEAVCQLAAWWYAQREAALVGVNAAEIPLGVTDIVNGYRDWSWGEADTDAD